MSDPVESRATTGPPTEPAANAEPAAVEWGWNPWHERPGRAAVALAFTLASCVALLASGNTVLAALLALAVGGTLSPLLIPSRCRVDGDGIAARHALGWERRPWPAVRRQWQNPDAVVVSPFARAHPLDRFRALVLPLPAHQRDRLLGAVRMHFARHGL